uniref:Uncharacterized protein n=1 Tax=Arion vulgaris TaxID=1028688 RepID=A0A0B7BUL1_9EUPU
MIKHRIRTTMGADIGMDCNPGSSVMNEKADAREVTVIYLLYFDFTLCNLPSVKTAPDDDEHVALMLAFVHE